MPTGKLTQYNHTRGFGFIEATPIDAFVHYTALEAGDIRAPVVGMMLEYELAPGRNGKQQAANIRLLDKHEAETELAWLSRDKNSSDASTHDDAPMAPVKMGMMLNDVD